MDRLFVVDTGDRGCFKGLATLSAHHRRRPEATASAVFTRESGQDPDRGGRRLARGVAKAGMGGQQHKIAYRCDAARVRLVEAPGDYPSTRICSDCDAVQEMPLRRRVYECPRCGLVMDRDANAALNLQHYGGAQGR